MTKPEQVILSEPVHALEITAKGSGIPIDLTIINAPQGSPAHISYEIPADNKGHESDIVLTANLREKGTLCIDVSSPTKRGFFDLIKSGGNKGNAVKLTIALPNEITSVSAVIGMGGFKWEGANVSKEFIAVIDMGKLKIKTLLTLETMDLTVSTGGIVVTGEASVSNSALSAKNGLGGVNVTLKPGVDSSTVLSCSGAEDVTAKVSGFEGKFSARATSLGSVSVKAPGGIS
ncbi:UNVERIFIED_CONTAM: hypothetical protein HDU68_010512 [Siphonaria sp. JEL0065]|nr:hypothetical protein HDU68_010512 [Siphonaria sp. JEL0065]